MVSDYVMTEHDVQGRRSAEDPVALGSYFMDSHSTRRYLDKQGYIRIDGGLSAPRGFAPYGISFRSITPKAQGPLRPAVALPRGTPMTRIDLEGRFKSPN